MKAQGMSGHHSNANANGHGFHPSSTPSVHGMSQPFHGKPDVEKKLHPFFCSLCKMKFNAGRGLKFHKCEFASQPKESKDSESATDKTRREAVASDASRLSLSQKEEESESKEDDMCRIEIKDGRRWYCCKLCPKSFLNRCDMIPHVARHTNQSKKRKLNVTDARIDRTRFGKSCDSDFASVNPSVQVNIRDAVLFRGSGRRPWVTQIQSDIQKDDA